MSGAVPAEASGRRIARPAVVIGGLAALLAMLGILTYVAMRYEFSFAVGAVVAVSGPVAKMSLLLGERGSTMGSTSSVR